MVDNIDRSLQKDFEEKSAINKGVVEKNSEQAIFQSIFSEVLKDNQCQMPKDLTLKLYDSFNEANGDVLKDFMSSEDFHKLTFALLEELVSTWFNTNYIWSYSDPDSIPIESKKKKIKEYINNFCDYFQEYIFSPELPKHNPGFMMAQFLDKMVMEVLGYNPDINFPQLKAELSNLAKEKGLTTFLKEYKKSFEVVLRNFIQQTGGEELSPTRDFKDKLIKILFWREKENEEIPKLSARRVCSLVNHIKEMYQKYPQHNLGELDIGTTPEDSIAPS